MRKVCFTFLIAIALIVTGIPVTTSHASDVEAEKRAVKLQISEIQKELVIAKREERVSNSSKSEQEIEAAKATTNALELKLTVLKNNYIRLVDKSNGKITRKIASGVYFGEVNEENLMEGVGQANWENNSKYIGSWKDGKMSGTGKYLYESGSYYEGEFENDVFSGHGLYVTNEGGVFEGTFEADLIIKGKYKEKNLQYTGYFENYKFEGYGVLNTKDGIYTGLFSKNKILSGSVSYKDGSVYNGKFVNNEPSGYGMLKKIDGTILKGEFKEGKFQK